MIMVMIILRRGSDFSRNENSFKTWIYLIVEFCCKREDISFLFCILFKTVCSWLSIGLVERLDDETGGRWRVVAVIWT